MPAESAPRILVIEPTRPVAMALDRAIILRDRLALDRASVRTIDQDGHLHVKVSPISKSNVCPYRGGEIPGFEALGLDPERVYQLLRDPAELAKAASTFNGKPLLNLHRPQTAEDHDHELTVGSVNNASFEDPYLLAELVVWDAGSIAGIETGQQCELSSGYRYDADMTPGEYKGVRFDGVMRNIRGNHVALVEKGRAGADVVVGDSAFQPAAPKEKPPVAKTPALSRKALLASGALRAHLAPRLAADAAFDPAAVLKGVTAKNWKASKPKIKAALDTALTGKLAADADLDDVVTLLDKLDDVTDEVADVVADPPADPTPVEKTAVDADPMEELKAFLADKLSEEDMARCLELMQPAPAAVDAAPDLKPDDKKDPKPMDKPAMDAAIRLASDAAVRRATDETVARMNAIREAERDVRPYVGETAVAMDSALAVYQFALDSLGVDHKGVESLPALKLVLSAQPKPGDAPAGTRPKRLAMDAATATDYAKRFPNANRLAR